MRLTRVIYFVVAVSSLEASASGGPLCGRVLTVSCYDNTIDVLVDQQEQPRSVRLRPDTPTGSAHDLLYKNVCIDGSKRKDLVVSDFRIEPSQTPIAPLDPRAAHICGAPGLQLPKAIHMEGPRYPPSVREAGVTGEVLVEAVIESDGSLGATRILRSPRRSRELADEALRTLRRWRFSPGTLNGVPTAALMIFGIKYELR